MYVAQFGGAIVSKLTQPKLPAFTEWLARATAGETQTQIAERLGVSRATVARWARRSVLDPNTVLAIARAYNADPIQGLLASGWLEPGDLENGGMRYLISVTPTSTLVRELYRRFGNS